MYGCAPDGVELNIETKIGSAHDRDRLVHASWGSPCLSLPADDPFDEFLLVLQFTTAGVRVYCGKGRANAECWRTGDASCQRNISLYKHVQTDQLLNFKSFHSRTVSRPEIFHVVIGEMNLCFRVNWDGRRGVHFWMYVIYANFLRLCLSHSDETILLDGSRQHAVSFIVYVLSNDVHSSRCSSDEFWLFPIEFIESVEDELVPLGWVTRVKVANLCVV